MDLVSKVTKLLAMASRSTRHNPSLDDLRPNSRYLVDLSHDFLPIAYKYAIISIFECKKVKLVGRMVSINHPLNLLVDV